MTLTNIDMTNLLLQKSKVKDLSNEQKKDIWESDFSESELPTGYYQTYISMKEQCKPEEKLDDKIEAMKASYAYERPFTAYDLEEFVTDCGKFGVFDRDFIIGMLTLKVSTLVNTGEPPILQISGDSGVGKTYSKTVVTAGFGWIPYLTGDDVVYYRSVSNMGGTPAVAVYTTDPEDKADGMIMDFDDQRNVSDLTTQIFLQSTNAPFMERPTYKSVVNLQSVKFYFAPNQRFILTAVHLPKALLDAGMNTRALKVNVTKQDERELQRFILSSGDLQERLKRFSKKWSAFWTNLYDAVYFKGKRSFIDVPEKYKEVEIFLNLGASRSYQHLRAITAVFALFRDPTAVMEGRPLMATDEEVEKAAAFVRSHVLRSMEEDATSALSGQWTEGDVVTLIAESIMRGEKNSFTFDELEEVFKEGLKANGVTDMVKRRAYYAAKRFSEQECKEANGFYKISKKN